MIRGTGIDRRKELRKQFWIWPLVLALTVESFGCRQAATPSVSPSKTGAEEVAKIYFDCIVRQDWSAAYDTLDPESRKWCSKDEFARRAKSQLDFMPSEVAVSVSESGDRATAAAVFRGFSGESKKQHRDGVALRRTADGWVVVLRQNFGN